MRSMSNDHDDGYLCFVRGKHCPIRNLYFHQRQKEAAEWQRKKERLRPRRQSNRDI